MDNLNRDTPPGRAVKRVYKESGEPGVAMWRISDKPNEPRRTIPGFIVISCAGGQELREKN